MRIRYIQQPRFALTIALVIIWFVATPCVVRGEPGPDVGRLLQEWAAAGSPSPDVVAAVFGQIDITKAEYEAELLQEIHAAASLRPPGAGPAAFEREVRLALDQHRFTQVQKALDKVYAVYGKDLEAVVRTGSSGIRHLNMDGYLEKGSGYRMLFSDDDISFVGKRSVEAASMFNKELANAGLSRVKVNGFDLLTLKNVRNLDLVALDLLDPEKFLGASGMAAIKGEMLKNGAVIAKNTGSGLGNTAERLAAFVEAKKSAMLAELMDEKAIAGVVRKYGSMTMVASCERQIAEAHGGWDKLTAPEKVKYVLRQRKALKESGALRDIAELGASNIDAEIEYLENLKKAGALTERENLSLLTMRQENVRLAFKEIPRKLNPLLEAATADGRSLAANPEVRKAIEELATGFALLRNSEAAVPATQILEELRRVAGDSREVYSVLYTAYEQGQDLLEMAEHWKNTGGTRVSFVEMLERTANRAERLAQARMRKAAKAGVAEEKSLSVLEELLGTPEGDSLFLQMAKNPAAKRYLVAALGTVGGAAILKSMYDSWMQGDEKFRQDLSGVAMTLLELAPGGMSMSRAVTEGVDAHTAFLFIKDALYFSPAWPLILTGDVMAFGWDIASSMHTATLEAGLVDIFVYSGRFELSGDAYKFRALSLPDGRTIEQTDLKSFLFETKKVLVNGGRVYEISDLSEAANKVLNTHYVASDRVLQEMRAAADQQLAAINNSTAWGHFLDGNPFSATADALRWMAGIDSVCKDSDKNWCKVFGALQRQIEERRKILITDGMIPQLIEMAEVQRLKLDAPKLFKDKLADLQKAFDQLRGSPLGVTLVDQVEKAAVAKAGETRTDTSTQSSLKYGEVWQTAYLAYKRNGGRWFRSNLSSPIPRLSPAEGSRMIRATVAPTAR